MGRRADRDDVTALLTVTGQAHGRGIHSPLYRWMRARHDRLFEGLTRPRWDKVAEFLASKGVVDGDGKPPSAENVRATWYRVRQDVAAMQARCLEPSERRPKQTVGIDVVRHITPEPAALAMAPPSGPAGNLDVTAARPRARLDVRPARPLGSTSAISDSPSTPSAAARPGPGNDPDEQIRKLFERMGANKTKVPRIVE